MTLKRTTISLSAPVLAHYQEIANDQRRSLSSIIEEMLKVSLAPTPRKKKGVKA